MLDLVSTAVGTESAMSSNCCFAIRLLLCGSFSALRFGWDSLAVLRFVCYFAIRLAALRFGCCFAIRLLLCDAFATLRYCCFAMRLPLCVFSAASRFVCHVAIRLRFGCCFAIRLLLCDSFAVLGFVCCLAIRQLPAFKQPGSSQAQPGQPRASQGTTWDQQIRIQIPTEHQWGAARFPSCAPSEFARGFTCFSAFQGP